MQILLTNRYNLVNGTQTMIVRMARYLREQGHSVYFMRYGSRPVELLDDIARHATLVNAHEVYTAGVLRRPTPLDQLDVLHSFTTDTWLFNLWVQRHVARHASVVIGTYHPQHFQIDCRLWTYEQHLLRKVMARTPSENVMFMTEAVKRAQQAFFGRSFDTAPVIPIPIEYLEHMDVRRRTVDRRKLVNVGRLHPSRSYQSAMLDVVAKLTAMGHDYRFHIVGDGPTRPALEAKARNLDIASRVVFHGQLPYRELGPIVSDAFAFVGGGTTALEAAAAGVPLFLTSGFRPPTPVTYGLFHRVPGDELGDPAQGLPEYDLVDEIIKLERMNDDEYRDVSEAVRMKASHYGMTRVMDEYLRFWRGAKRYRYPIHSWMVAPLAASYVERKLFPVGMHR